MFALLKCCLIKSQSKASQMLDHCTLDKERPPNRQIQTKIRHLPIEGMIEFLLYDPTRGSKSSA